MQVGRNVVVGVGVAFVGLVAIVCFLLGRESNRRAPVQTVEVVHTMPGSGPELEPVAPALRPPVPVPVPLPDPQPPVPRPDVIVPPAKATPMPELAGNPFTPDKHGDEMVAVRDYFIKMDAIQVMPGSTDAGDFANKLLAAAVNGDMSGFDDIVTEAESSAERARAISPPAPCRAYHEKMLALLGESTEMVKKLKVAIKGNDTAALAQFASVGNAMQARLTAVEAEGRALKTKFGIH